LIEQFNANNRVFVNDLQKLIVKFVFILKILLFLQTVYKNIYLC